VFHTAWARILTPTALTSLNARETILMPRASSFAHTVALLAPVAHAGVVTFDASGTFQDGSVLSGTMLIDTAIGSITGGDLAVSGNAADFTSLELQRTWPPTSPFLTEVQFGNGRPTANSLTFLFPPVSLVGYTGGIICGISSTCIDQAGLHYFSNISTFDGQFFSNFIDLDSGSLRPAGVPEPSTAVLSLAGLALAALRLRRRSRSSN
jgi:hypothetical protein